VKWVQMFVLRQVWSAFVQSCGFMQHSSAKPHKAAQNPKQHTHTHTPLNGRAGGDGSSRASMPGPAASTTTERASIFESGGSVAVEPSAATTCLGSRWAGGWV